MPAKVIYAALTGSYNDAKLGNAYGDANNHAAPVYTMASSYTDPRLNAFLDAAGAAKVDVCNRGGAPGSAGAGTHWVLNAPLDAAANPPANLTVSHPNRQAGLDAIANPYAVAVAGGRLYFIEFDTPNIQAVDMSNYSIISYEVAGEERPAYTFTITPPPSPAKTNCGVDLELGPDGKLYALFSSGNSFAGPWDPSILVKLTVNTDGSLTEDARVSVGANAAGMAQVKFNNETYMLVACIGGAQNAGSGNRENSVVSVVQIGTNFGLVADAVNGIFQAIGGIPLDFKAVAATPTANNDAYVFFMNASYNAGWLTNWAVHQVKASAIINKAIARKADPSIALLNLGDSAFTLFDNGVDDPGYFWTVAFHPEGGGVAGQLVIGCGDPSGDQLRFRNVTANGASRDLFTADSQALYGATGCVLNTITLIPAAGLHKSIKTLRSALPHPVASGRQSLAEFAAEQAKAK